MPTVGQDLFAELLNTDLNLHLADTGENWILEAANFVVRQATDDVDHTTTTTHMARKDDNIGDDDMDVSVDAKTQAANTTRLAGVAGRMTTADFSNAFRAYLQGDTVAADLVFEKIVAGSVTNLGSYNANIADDTYATIKLVLRAASRTAWLNGVERISDPNADALVGNQYAGIVQNGNAGAKVRVDNFLSESVAAAGHPAMRRFGLVAGMRPVEVGRDGVAVM